MPIVRKQRHTTKVSLIVSAVFHTVIVAALVFLAAREGYLGKQLKTIAVTMAPKEEKPPEKPKEPERPPEPPPDKPKTVEPLPKLVEQAPVVPPAPTTIAAPPPALAPAAAPPPNALAGFAFSDGAKVVETSSDPVQLYRGFVEFSLRSKWRRPEGIADEDFLAEIELNVSSTGKIVGTTWKRGSGNATWDATVRRAIAETPRLSRPPPARFPERFVVRFDVVQEADSAIVFPP